MDNMKYQDHLKLINEETGLRMDFDVKEEITLHQRMFLVLTPAAHGISEGWMTLMDDPEKAFCILEKRESAGRTVYLPVGEELLAEVFQVFELGCGEPAETEM